MMWIEAERPSADAGMVQELAERLRLPSGFGEDAARDARLARLLDAALRVVEARTGRALLRRALTIRRNGWEGSGGLTLPLGPALAVSALTLEGPGGDRQAVDPGLWRLDGQAGRWAILPRPGRRLPNPPRDGFIEAAVAVGHGAGWADAPADLRQATIELAAVYHDEGPAAGGPPPVVAALLEPYRRVRL
jgi:uncharacterized phiE125 gp8 family phage protein